jgi:hypothetical protein
MAYGLPVVALNWSGLDEYIGDLDTGMLVATSGDELPAVLTRTALGRDEEMLCQALESCLVWSRRDAIERLAMLSRDGDLRARLGAAARQQVEAWSPAHAARQHVDFFQRCRDEAQPEAPPFRPLVDMDNVCASLAASALTMRTRIRLRRRDNLRFLEARAQLPAQRFTKGIVAALEHGSEQSMAELLDQLGIDGRSGDTEWPEIACLLQRWSAFGIVDLVAPMEAA